MKEIGNGAEAILYKKANSVVKDRVPKSYRIPVLDEKLRVSRTRRERKILEKLAPLGFVPAVTYSDKTTLTMDFISGKKVRDMLTAKNAAEVGTQIGSCLGQMHTVDIIHGDLTTSNMIVDDALYVIDFGLSYVSTRVEDKAVDLHVLKQALEAYHHKIWETVFAAVVSEYSKTYSDASAVLSRFEVVEKRGRNKH